MNEGVMIWMHEDDTVAVEMIALTKVMSSSIEKLYCKIWLAHLVVIHK
jgi:hypothetical protein